MKRIEIIANHAVEEDIIEALGELGVAGYYTKIPVVQGIGSSGPKYGDAVWPEENFMLIVYCKDTEALLIKQAVHGVKKRFAQEGIKLFELEAV